MELSYWQSKWQKGKIGFHMKNGYPGLEKHWHSLRFDDKPTVLVPLCGKSKDLSWLSDRCKQVVGVEISKLAVEQFLDENSLDATMAAFADFKIYRTGNIELWNGDFFKLPKHKLPSFHLVYDRAALVALPAAMRKKYAQKIINLVAGNTQILLHTFEYPQAEMPGPPFSVSADEVNKLYSKQFDLKVLEKKDLGINHYRKFKKRGLQSYFIEILSLLLPKEE